ncbi:MULTISPECIES: FMN-dependent NADH-azoreductase [Paenibacillus]|uniref:FMN-dependent NADH-azoreductase n=1 Tax=Paenibacillus TaxID=44249 RepID=UPI00203CD0A7|nr:FMN-dependent NADH-azoreductase [Paenibacillus camelliae]MCM3633954.1 FMN-dependent NADH-azoreductase [Paenibacillus camelliae]
MKVLLVKANNRPASDAVSSKMFEAFQANLKGAEVSTFDVFAEDMPYFGQDFFDAFGRAQAGTLTDNDQRLLAAKQKAMDALSAADVVVFAFPLWNLTIPAALQTFIDYTYQAGYSFKYNEQGQMVSLLTDKKAIFLNARGGIYSSPEAAPMEMSLNYMRNVIGGVYGMEIIDEVVIEGHAANPAQAETIIAEGIEKVKAAAEKLSLVAAK